MKFAFIVDPLDTFQIYKDTTFAMMREAARRGHVLHAMQQDDLFWRDGVVRGRAARLALTGEKPAWYRTEAPVATPLVDFDAVLMRKDPPFDMEYVYSTYLLELAEAAGARVVNRPRAIRDCNEKMGIARFTRFAAPTMAARSDGPIREFLAEHGDVILKPLDGMGGASIFRLRKDDPNLNVIIETVTQHGQRTIMAQRYIPEIRDGDKRILLIGGQVVPYALARIPKPGETRGNLAAGGTGVARELTARDREIAESLAPVLAADGLLLVGIDVIGDYLTEVNVTSPTCFQEITQQTGFDVADLFVNALEAACQGGRTGRLRMTPRQEAATARFVLTAPELEHMSAHGIVRTFPRNAAVVNEGDRTDSLYVILQGRVKAYVADADGKEAVLSTQGPGEYLGGMVLDEGPRSASVITLEPSRFLVVPRADFRNSLAQNPAFAARVIEKLIHRVRALTENVKSLALMDVYGRIARLLRSSPA